jgi:hypothetical protein
MNLLFFCLPADKVWLVLSFLGDRGADGHGKDVPLHAGGGGGLGWRYWHARLLAAVRISSNRRRLTFCGNDAPHLARFAAGGTAFIPQLASHRGIYRCRRAGAPTTSLLPFLLYLHAGDEEGTGTARDRFLRGRTGSSGTGDAQRG